ATNVHGDDALAVDNAPKVRDGSTQTSVARVQVGAKLGDRHGGFIPLLAALEGLRESALLVLIHVGPAWRLHELVERLLVCGEPSLEPLIETTVVLGLDRLRVLLD